MSIKYEYKFTAKWYDTGEDIPDFMKDYALTAVNDDDFIVKLTVTRITTEDVTDQFVTKGGD